MSEQQGGKIIVGLPSTIVHDGFLYKHKKLSKLKDSALYYCKHQRSCSCPSKIKIFVAVGSVTVVSNSHSERCVAKLFKKVVYAESKENTCVVITDVMKAHVKDLAINSSVRQKYWLLIDY